MDRARDQFLADAALSLQQHRRVGWGGALDGVPDLAEVRALAHHLMPHFDRALERLVLVRQPRPLERVADRDQQLLARRRLFDEVERSRLRRLDRGADGAVTGNDHHGQVLVVLPQLLQHFETVHARHLDIEKHEVRRLAFGQRNTLRAARRLDHVIVVVAQDHPHRAADLGLVINDQNACFHLNWVSDQSTTTVTSERWATVGS